jgi:hypothetical protein
MCIITLRIVGFLEFLQWLVFRIQHYGKWICFHHKELWLGRHLLIWVRCVYISHLMLLLLPGDRGWQYRLGPTE